MRVLKLDDYKFLRDIEKISQDNLFIDYIVNRVVSSDYRGIQCSQHNRLTYDYFSSVIDVIYKIAGTEVFGIHIGDDHGIRQAHAAKYYDIVDEIKRITDKGTINSIKKNTFPDIARMGFIERYDKNGNKIWENHSRKAIGSVGLSENGIKFATSSGFDKIKAFTDGIDHLTKNTASELVELLYLNDYGIDSIDILEYMYIFSDDRDEITTDDKLRLLLEYRKLSAAEKASLDTCLKQFCNPQNRKQFDNKTLLRDYSNWKNESQQIYGLLANSTYFKVNGTKLILNTGHYGLFDKNTNRGEKAKRDYFKFHNVKKARDYDLHHIIPFSKVQNKNDAIFIDSFKNLIYLTKDKHSQFTSHGSQNVIMSYSTNDSNVFFRDFNDSIILVDTNKDALVSKRLLPNMLEYNKTLLKKFYNK